MFTLLSAGGSMTVIFEKLAGYFSLNLEDMFVLVSAVYFLNSLANLLFLTPDWIDSGSQTGLL